MTSRGFCAHGNVATVIGNKVRASIVCWLQDRKLGWASKSACWDVNCLSQHSSTQADFQRISSLVTDHISNLLLNEDWPLWQGSQPALSRTGLPRHQASRVILFGAGTQGGHVLPVTFNLIKSPPRIPSDKLVFMSIVALVLTLYRADKSKLSC